MHWVKWQAFPFPCIYNAHAPHSHTHTQSAEMPIAVVTYAMQYKHKSEVIQKRAKQMLHLLYQSIFTTIVIEAIQFIQMICRLQLIHNNFCALLAHISTTDRANNHVYLAQSVWNSTSFPKITQLVNRLVFEPKWKPLQNHTIFLCIHTLSTDEYRTKIDHAHQTIWFNYVNLNMLICSNQKLNEWWILKCGFHMKLDRKMSLQ